VEGGEREGEGGPQVESTMDYIAFLETIEEAMEYLTSLEYR
jgi:hypothetical protein